MGWRCSLRYSRVVLLVAALVACHRAVAAQDLVVNGHFNTNIDGWTLQGFGSQAWDPLDWEANPLSGSISLTNTRSAPNQVTVSGQCIPLNPSGTYEFGVHVRFPSGQSTTGFGTAGVTWFDNPSCQGAPLVVSNAPLIPSATTDTWVESFLSGESPPPGTAAVGVGPVVIKINAGGSLQALFDRVHFGPAGTTPAQLQRFTVE